MKSILQTSYKRKSNSFGSGILDIKKISSSKLQKEQEDVFRIRCEANFGHTVGVVLRRIVLSGIEGMSVAALSLNNIQHIFSSVKGIKESALDIYMNLKKLVFKAEDSDFDFCFLELNKKTGEHGGVVTAKDFEETPLLSIVNSDLHICTLDNGGEIDLKIIVVKGIGYIAESNHIFTPMLPEGFIAVDSYFGSVLNCGYKVEIDTSREVETDILELSIRTNGSISPEEVLEAAGAKAFKLFAKFSTAAEKNLDKEEETTEEIEDVNEEFLDQKIESIKELSVRSKNCLLKHNIEAVRDLIAIEENVLLSLDGVGNKSFEEIKAFLHKNGLRFAQKRG